MHLMKQGTQQDIEITSCSNCVASLGKYVNSKALQGKNVDDMLWLLLNMPLTRASTPFGVVLELHSQICITKGFLTLAKKQDIKKIHTIKIKDNLLAQQSP